MQATTSLINHLTHQPPHPSTAFQTSMSSLIYHILLPLADLSLIYSCRLHVQSIFIPAAYPAIRKSAYPLLNWSTYIPAACSAMGESAYQLLNWSTYIPAACSVMGEPAYLLATQLIHPHTSRVVRNGGLCLPAGSAMENLSTSCMLRDGGTCVLTGHSIDQSTYQLHTPRPGNLPISHVIGQSMS